MHPLGVSQSNYMKAIKIHQDKNLSGKDRLIAEWEWEQRVGKPFPWCFPNCKSLGLLRNDDYDKVIRQPGLYTKGRLS